MCRRRQGALQLGPTCTTMTIKSPPQKPCQCIPPRQTAHTRGPLTVQPASPSVGAPLVGALVIAPLAGPSWTKELPLQFFALLRVPSRIRVLKLPFSLSSLLTPLASQLAVLSGPSWTKELPLQFFALLRVPSRIRVLKLPFSLSSLLTPLASQLAVLSGPSWTKELQFFALLRFPSRIRVLKLTFPLTSLLTPLSSQLAVLSGHKGAAVAVLRASSRPFADEGVEVAVLSILPSHSSFLAVSRS